MRTIKLTMAYDGGDYAGWQSQADQVTLQDTLEQAIARITGESIRVEASGRTDAGVHALGQVVSLLTDSPLSPEVLQQALNARLPRDMLVRSVEEMPEGFHARRAAKRKRYRYHIDDGPLPNVFERRYVWWYPRGQLDVEAMARAAQPLAGQHDFASFESHGSERETTERTVFELSVRRGDSSLGDALQIPLPPGEAATAARPRRGGERSETGEGGRELTSYSTSPHPSPLPEGEGAGSRILIDIEADGFLYNMVRTIVGTLVEVGRGAQGESWPAEVLAAADRRAAGPTAPAHGLCLLKVDYD